MSPSIRYIALAGLAATLLPQALAQTSTICNPLNATCPADAALGTNATFLFNETSANSELWNTTAGTIDYNSTGGQFTISEKGVSPTLISNFFIFFGRVDVVMKSATGQGIVSSIVLESDDLDEVDFEWIGGNNKAWQSNYFGKGNTTSYDRAVWHDIDDPQGTFHNYSVDWTKEKIDWYVDSEVIRTLNYEDANGGDNFPQTPMNLRLGIWAGGDPDSNSYWTVQWAGGNVSYDDVPFTMTVREVFVQDYSSGKEYKYGDNTGSYDSIKIVNGTSEAYQELYVPSGTTAKWDSLPTWAKAAIGVGSVALVAVAAAGFLMFFMKKRREGRVAYQLQEQNVQKEQEELLEYKSNYQQIKGNSTDIHR